MKLTFPVLLLTGLSAAAAVTYWPDNKPEPQASSATLDVSNTEHNEAVTKAALKAELKQTATRSAVLKTEPKPSLVQATNQALPATSVENQEPPDVVYRDGALSVSVNEKPLKSVLALISAKSGLPINFIPGVGDENIKVSFAGVFMEQGLKSLLGQYDTFYWHGSSGKVDGVLRAVWIYPKGHGALIKLMPAEQWASTSDYSMNLMHSDPTIRGTAIEGLISRQGATALSNVLETLKDSDSSVRFRALYKANNAGLPIPVNTLLALANQDASSEIRITALKILAEQPNIDKKLIAETAQYGLSDPDPVMRSVAEEVLAQLTPHEETPEYMVQ